LDFARSKVALFPKSLNNWQAKGESLSRSGKITSYDILVVVDRVETVSLYGEEVLDTTSSQFCHRRRDNLRETGERVILNNVCLHGGSVSLFSAEATIITIVTLVTSTMSVFVLTLILLVTTTIPRITRGGLLHLWLRLLRLLWLWLRTLSLGFGGRFTFVAAAGVGKGRWAAPFPCLSIVLELLRGVALAACVMHVVALLTELRDGCTLGPGPSRRAHST